MLPVHASFDAPVRCANEALYDADDGGGVAAKWHIVRTAGVVHAMQIAAIYLESTSLMSPMCGELGLSIAQIALPLNVFRAVNVALLMPAGALLDRYGVFRALWPSAGGCCRCYGGVLAYACHGASVYCCAHEAVRQSFANA
eukprot:IDg16438t1